MFDVDVRTASAIAPMSAFSLLAKSAATLPQSVLNGDGVGAEEAHGDDVVDERDELAVHGVEDALRLRAVATNARPDQP